LLTTMKVRQVKATNVLRIYNRMRQSPVTLDVLHDWAQKSGIDVSRRTLYRYLEDLVSSVAFPGERLVVYENEFNKKVWKIEFEKSGFLLNQYDINSYYILRNFIPQSLSQPRQSSLEKLDTLLYGLASKSRFQLNVDANNLYFQRTNYIDAVYNDNDHALLENLVWAMQNHRKIKIEQFDWDRNVLPKGLTEGMLVLPLKMVFHFGLVYYACWSEDADRIVMLPLNKILRISSTNLTFNAAPYRPKLEEYLLSTFGMAPNYDDEVYDIEIEFAGHTGTFVEAMNWHASQKKEVLPNGNLLLKLRCGINRELLGFIMYFLHNARVRKPKRLKDLVINELEQTMEAYKAEKLMYRSALAVAVA